jgi:hypothetical protein
LPNPAQNFFWKISIAPELWTQRGVKAITNIKLKEYQYFYFSTKHAGRFTAMRYISTFNEIIICLNMTLELF